MPDHVRINPAFRRHPDEAEIIGRLVVGFGEIELAHCRNAAKALRFYRMALYDTVMNTLYRIRSTSTRIETADNLMRPMFVDEKLGAEYADCVRQILHCQKIRNQFAHCNWADDAESVGLFFTDLQSTELSAAGEFCDHVFKHVDAAILSRQEMFFSNTMDWLDYLDHEIATHQGKLDRNPWPLPAKLPPPLLHNPTAEHVPPWLGEGEKALHLARATAAQTGVPTPTRGQLELDAARAAKKARQEANNLRSRVGEARPAEYSGSEPNEPQQPQSPASQEEPKA